MLHRTLGAPRAGLPGPLHKQRVVMMCVLPRLALAADTEAVDADLVEEISCGRIGGGPFAVPPGEGFAQRSETAADWTRLYLQTFGSTITDAVNTDATMKYNYRSLTTLASQPQSRCQSITKSVGTTRKSALRHDQCDYTSKMTHTSMS